MPVAARDQTPRLGLATPFRGGTLRDIAAETLKIARAGLRARARLDRAGEDESGFLTSIDEVVSTGRTPAEVLLEAYETRWNRSVDPIYHELAY